MTHIVGTNHRGKHQLPVEHIMYAYADDDFVYVVNNETYKVNMKLYDIELIPWFVRINKSCAINVMKIKEANRLLNSKIKILLINNDVLYVNRTYIKGFKQFLQGGTR